MKRISIYLLIINSLLLNAQPLKYKWHSILNTDASAKLKYIDDNNIYCVTSTTLPVSGFFDIDSIVSADYYNIIVSKINANGDIIWYKLFSNNKYTDISDLSVDVEKNLYITGIFNPGTLSSGSLEIGTYTISGSGKLAFACKFDSLGDIKWATNIGDIDEYYGQVFDITTDIYKNTYVVGSFEGDDLNIKSEELSKGIRAKGFILKINPNGNLSWCRSIYGDNQHEIQSVCADPYGNIYFSGYLRDDTTYINKDKIILENENYGNLIIAKMDTAGNYIWRKLIFDEYEINGWQIQYSPDTSLVIGGTFRGSRVEFDGFLLKNSQVLSDDIYLLKMDTTSVVKWTKTIGNLLNDQLNGMEVDNHGRIFISGTFSNSELTLDNNLILKRQIEHDQGDMYVVKESFIAELNKPGKVLNGTTISTAWDEEMTNITVDEKRNVFAAVSIVDAFNVVDKLIISKDTINMDFPTHFMVLTRLDYNCTDEILFANDTNICPGKQIILKPSINGINHLWQNGYTGSTLSVNTPGEYSLFMQDLYMCDQKDTINVIYKSPELKEVLPADTVSCGTSLQIQIPQDYSLIKWSFTTLTDNPVTVNKSDDYSVIFENNEGCYTDTIKVEFKKCASVNNTKAPIFELYPNPANTEINIVFSDLIIHNLQISMVSLSGNTVKEIITSNTGHISIPLYGISSGMYFLLIDADNVRFSSKIIIK